MGQDSSFEIIEGTDPQQIDQISGAGYDDQMSGDMYDKVDSDHKSGSTGYGEPALKDPASPPISGFALDVLRKMTRSLDRWHCEETRETVRGLPDSVRVYRRIMENHIHQERILSGNPTEALTSPDTEMISYMKDLEHEFDRIGDHLDYVIREYRTVMRSLMREYTTNMRKSNQQTGIPETADSDECGGGV